MQTEVKQKRRTYTLDEYTMRFMEKWGDNEYS
jgi:hypothetical protein